MAKMIDIFMKETKCKIDAESRTFLLMNLFKEKKIIKAKILFRTSNFKKKEWNAQKFHSLCDNKGSTVSLFQLENGMCIGGYAEAQWTSEDKWVTDNNAFLFNLNQKITYPCLKPENAIYCHRKYGPFFGK